MVKSLHQSLEARLEALKAPEYDSDDVEENDEKNNTGSTTAKRGNGSKDKNRVASSTEKATEKPSRVIYLGHLPPGFEDREIIVFLNQFGNVKRCRVSRSKKTGRPRGYAFVEFADKEVAKVVAETMSGYFLLEKRLVCHVLPADKVHEGMFSTSKQPFSKAVWQKKAREEANKKRTAEGMKKITVKLVKREELKRKKFASLGIDYDFPGYATGKAKSTPGDGGSEEGEPNNKRRKMSAEKEKPDKESAEVTDEETLPATEDRGGKKINDGAKKSRKKKRKETDGAKSAEAIERDTTNSPNAKKTDVEKTKKPESKPTRQKKRKNDSASPPTSKDVTDSPKSNKADVAKTISKDVDKPEDIQRDQISKNASSKSSRKKNRKKTSDVSPDAAGDKKEKSGADTKKAVTDKTASKDDGKSEATDQQSQSRKKKRKKNIDESTESKKDFKVSASGKDLAVTEKVSKQTDAVENEVSKSSKKSKKGRKKTGDKKRIISS